MTTRPLGAHRATEDAEAPPPAVTLDGRRVCLYLPVSKPADGVHRPVIVVEGDAGYTQTSLDYGTNRERAQHAVDGVNADFGHSLDDVAAIIASSMFAR